MNQATIYSVSKWLLINLYGRMLPSCCFVAVVIMVPFDSTTHVFNFLLPNRPVPMTPMLNRKMVAGSGVGERYPPPFKK